MNVMLRTALRATSVVGLIASLFAASGDVRAQTLQPISVIVFPGGFNWPIWVAQDKGYFANAASR